MEGPSSFTASEWQALAAWLPGGGDEASIEIREKLFKELVVRAEACPHKRFKAKSSNFKGTLKLLDFDSPLRVILAKHGISPRCVEAVMALHAPALNAAAKWVDAVSVMEPGCVDMNQFHALVVYIACYLSLANCIAQMGLSESSDMMVDVQTFQGLLKALTDPAQALLGVPWASVSVFETWKESPKAALDQLAERDGCLSFDKLVETCIAHVVQAVVVSDQSSKNCRKRAFQLLQALNNTPSLPDSVPGPLSSRSAAEKEEAAVAPVRHTTSQWMTSNREGFPLFSPRVPQALYAPSHRITQRDMGWRVFPVDSNVSKNKSKFTVAGKTIAGQ